MIRIDITSETSARSDAGSVSGSKPVIAMCKRLIEAGYDPDARFECYTPRGVRSLFGRLGKMAARRLVEDQPCESLGPEPTSPPPPQPQAAPGGVRRRGRPPLPGKRLAPSSAPGIGGQK